MQHLWDCLSVVKLKFPDALDIVGFATESGRVDVGHGSEDAAYLDARNWTPERDADARKVQVNGQILLDPQRLEAKIAEYPVSGTAENRARNPIR